MREQKNNAENYDLFNKLKALQKPKYRVLDKTSGRMLKIEEYWVDWLEDKLYFKTSQGTQSVGRFDIVLIRENGRQIATHKGIEEADSNFIFYEYY